MAKLTLNLCLILGIWVRAALSEDKWVWSSGNGRSAKLAREPGGRYGVFEETDIPNEPYNPLVRPPPSNLPPLVRPNQGDRYDVRPNNSPNPGLGAFYNRPGAIGSDRLPPGGFDRPGQGFDRPGQGFDRPGQGLDRPYNRYPGDGIGGNRYPVSNPPVLRPPPPPIHPGKPGIINPDNDPTKFDKCKCTHSFNCKSPGIVFGSCDVGKKYCCEKRINHSNGLPIDDGSFPEVLAGPGGPVDNIKGQYPNRENIYGRPDPRRP